MKPMESRRHELLNEIAAHVASTAIEHGLPPETSEQLGASVADLLAETWGGQVISFPKDQAYRTTLRDAAILEAHYAGKSIAGLARDYGMSERGIRRLIKRAERRNPNHRQPGLFPLDH